MRLLFFFMCVMTNALFAQNQFSVTYQLQIKDVESGELSMNTLKIDRLNDQYAIAKSDEIYDEKIVVNDQQKKSVELLNDKEEQVKEAFISLYESDYLTEIEPFVDFLDLFFDDPVPAESMIETGETKLIQGQKCNKVSIVDENEKVFGYLYYLPNNHLKVFSQGEFFACEKGAVLEFEMEAEGIQLSLSCSDLSFNAPDLSVFNMDIPEGYTLLEAEDFDEGEDIDSEEGEE